MSPESGAGEDVSQSGQPQSKELTAATEAAAIAEKRKKQIEDELAAKKAGIELQRLNALGQIPATDLTSAAVAASKEAGAIEGSVLSARATKDVAYDIAHSVYGLAPGGFVLWTEDTPPSFDNAQAFAYRKLQLKTLFEEAAKALEGLDEKPLAQELDQFIAERSEAKFLPQAVNAIGGALEIASNVATYFQTKTTYGNVTTAGVDDKLLAAATAGWLRQWDCAVIDPAYVSTFEAFKSLQDDLADLIGKDKQATRDAAKCDSKIEQLTKRIAAAKKTESRKALEAEKRDFVEVKAALDKASSQFKELLASLAAETGGVALVNTILREQTLHGLLAKEGRKVLQVKIHTHGGTSITRESIWSWLPFVRPFKIGGGVVARFALLDTDGQVLMADSLDAYSGYRSVRGIRQSASHRRAVSEDRRAANHVLLEPSKDDKADGGSGI